MARLSTLAVGRPMLATTLILRRRLLLVLELLGGVLGWLGLATLRERDSRAVRSAVCGQCPVVRGAASASGGGTQENLKAARSFGVSVCHVWALPRGSLWAGGAFPPPARQWRASVPRMCCAHHGANVAHALRASATTQKAARPSRRLARCCTRAAPRGCGRARAAAAACKDGARGAASLWGLRWARGRRLWRPPTAVAAANHHIPRSPQLAAAESGRHAKRSVI